MSEIPSAPTTIGAEPNKNHTAVIITIIVIFGVIIVPLIFVGIVVFAILGFIDNHFDEFDFDRLMYGAEYYQDEGTPLTHNESVAVRNIVSMIENGTNQTGTISRRDCRYLERIAQALKSSDDNSPDSYYTFCSGDAIYVSANYETVEDEGARFSSGGQYKLYIINSEPTCSQFTFNGTLNAYKKYSFIGHDCSEDKMMKLDIIDTNEELEPSKKYQPTVNTEKDDEKRA